MNDREIRPIFIKIEDIIKSFIKGFKEGFNIGIGLGVLVLAFPFIILFTRRVKSND